MAISTSTFQINKRGRRVNPESLSYKTCRSSKTTSLFRRPMYLWKKTANSGRIPKSRPFGAVFISQRMCFKDWKETASMLRRDPSRSWLSKGSHCIRVLYGMPRNLMMRTISRSLKAILSSLSKSTRRWLSKRHRLTRKSKMRNREGMMSQKKLPGLGKGCSTLCANSKYFRSWIRHQVIIWWSSRKTRTTSLTISRR